MRDMLRQGRTNGHGLFVFVLRHSRQTMIPSAFPLVRRERLTSKDDCGGDTGKANDRRPACARVGQVQVHVVHIIVVILLLLIVVCHGDE